MQETPEKVCLVISTRRCGEQKLKELQQKTETVVPEKEGRLGISLAIVAELRIIVN